MNVEVLNTGTELLLGSVTNTHLAYFGQQLFPLGLRIGETNDHSGRTRPFARRCSMPFGTLRHPYWSHGGLGPTTDDVTREITAELLGFRLVIDETVARDIRERLARRRHSLARAHASPGDGS